MSPSTYSHQDLLTESEFPFHSSPSPPPYTTSPLFTTIRPIALTVTSNTTPPESQIKLSKKKPSVLSSFESLWGVERVSQTWGSNVNINSILNSPYRLVYNAEPSSKTAIRVKKDLERRKKENVWFKGFINSDKDHEGRRKAAALYAPWA